MSPARKGFEAYEFSVEAPQLRLVVQGQLARSDGAPQVGLPRRYETRSRGMPFKRSLIEQSLELAVWHRLAE